MQGKFVRIHLLFAAAFGWAGVLASAEEEAAAQPPPVAIVISIKDQKLALLENGGLARKFPISTSKFGLGDSYGSYKTPVGQLRVCDKIGDGLTPGSVIRHRSATGEILPANAAGRDPIVTRILWLEGMEAQNDHAKSRGIYIHGTVEESKVGEPVSYGCIRMKSRDVLEVFAAVPVGTPVQIIEEKLPRFAKPAPVKPEVVIVKHESKPATTATLAVAPPPAEKPAARPVFGERPAVAKSGAAAKSVEVQRLREAKAPAGAVLLAEGREVAAAPGGKDDSARRIHVSMKNSILFAGLPELAAAPPPEKGERPAKQTSRTR